MIETVFDMDKAEWRIKKEKRRQYLSLNNFELFSVKKFCIPRCMYYHIVQFCIFYPSLLLISIFDFPITHEYCI